MLGLARHSSCTPRTPHPALPALPALSALPALRDQAICMPPNGACHETRQSRADIVVRGKLPSVPDDGLAQFIAAAPPDYRSSFAGSGLPYATPEQAFYSTPNRGVIKVGDDGAWQLQLVAPGAFYKDGGTTRVPPTVFFTYQSKGQQVQTSVLVSDGIPFRSLDHDERRTGAMFYAPAPQRYVRSQEQILRESAYPDTNQTPADFWGGRPPM